MSLRRHVISPRREPRAVPLPVPQPAPAAPPHPQPPRARRGPPRASRAGAGVASLLEKLWSAWNHDLVAWQRDVRRGRAVPEETVRLPIRAFPPALRRRVRSIAAEQRAGGRMDVSPRGRDHPPRPPPRSPAVAPGPRTRRLEPPIPLAELLGPPPLFERWLPDGSPGALPQAPRGVPPPLPEFSRCNSSPPPAPPVSSLQSRSPRSPVVALFPRRPRLPPLRSSPRPLQFSRPPGSPPVPIAIGRGSHPERGGGGPGSP